MKPHKILSRLFLLAFITTLFASHSKGQQAYNDNGLLIEVLEVQQWNGSAWRKTGVYQPGVRYRLKIRLKNTNCEGRSKYGCYSPNRNMYIRDVELAIVIPGANWEVQDNQDESSKTSIQRFLTDCSEDLAPQSSKTVFTNAVVYTGNPFFLIFLSNHFFWISDQKTKKKPKKRKESKKK